MSELVDPYGAEQPAELTPPSDNVGWAPLVPADDWCDDGPMDDGMTDDGMTDDGMTDDGIAAGWLELAAVAAADDLERAVGDAELEELDAATVVDRLTGTTARANAVLIDQLCLVAHWADLHSHVDDSPVPGAERLVTIGGDGTPAVAEFASAELGVALHVSTGSAWRLMADVLDLRHRLPSLWQRTLTGEVPVSKARRVAEDTRRLSAEAAAAVDASPGSRAGSPGGG